MDWIFLSKEWQYVFTLAWETFKQGNLPIAAAIFNEEGKLISEGVNCLHSGNELYPNKKVAHAEAMCIQKIDSEEDPHTFTLYTTMEPCPMCMGTIIMANIRNVKIACRDAWAGFAGICEKHHYTAKKNMQIEFMDEIYGNLHIALHGYVELRDYGEGKLFECFKKDYPIGGKVAEELYSNGLLDTLVEANASAEKAVNRILEKIMEQL